MRRSPWLWLAVGVGAFDVYLIRHDRPTLSAEAANVMRHPIKRWPAVCAWIYLSAHLSGWLSEERDPLSRVARFLSPNGRSNAWD